MKVKLLLPPFIFFFLFPSQGWSLLQFEDAVFPELVTGGRPLAMGNAFLNKSDDSHAVFYNPAGLGTVRWTHLHLTNLHIESNKGLIRSGTGGNLREDVPKNAFKGFNLEGTRQLLLENRGKLTHNRFNAMPNLTTRYFSMGYMYSRQTRATIGTAEDAKFEFAFRQDHGPFVALNLSLFGGIFKFGTTGVYLNRKELLEEVDRDQSLNIQDEAYKKGRALVMVVGSRLVLPFTFLPTFGVTFHNAAGSDFGTRGGVGAPEQIKESIDFGISLTPQIGNVVRTHFEMNYKDIGKKYPGVSTVRKVLLGIELDFARVMFVRFGYGDGFGSAGLGIKSKRLEFDLTTYAVDTTSSEFRGKEDRRFAMTISSGI